MALRATGPSVPIEASADAYVALPFLGSASINTQA
jgi:hypothetical protein